MVRKKEKIYEFNTEISLEPHTGEKVQETIWIINWLIIFRKT
jgi:hypothetical protein